MPKRTDNASGASGAKRTDDASGASGAGAGAGAAAAAALPPPAKKPRAGKLPPSAHAGPAPEACTDGLSTPAASLAALAAALPAKPAGCLRLACYNVNGLRATFNPDRVEGMQAWLAAEQPDIVALQEIKCSEADAAKLLRGGALAGFKSHNFWHPASDKAGYAGTALLVADAAVAAQPELLRPLGVGYGLGLPALDGHGRVTTLEFAGWYVVNVYVPNSGQKLERLEHRTGEWDPALRAFVCALRGLPGSSLPGALPPCVAPAAPAPAAAGGGGKQATLMGFVKPAAGAAADSSASPAPLGPLSLAPKPVLLVGDLNVCHQDLDLYNAAAQRNKVAGFCDGERDGFAALLATGLADVYRDAHPTTRQFTYWSARPGARAENRGWRLDYALVGAAAAGGRADPAAAAGAAAAASSSSSSSSSAAAAAAATRRPLLAPGTVHVAVRGDWPGPSDHVPIIVDIRV
jgi:exodeoxyribonuclease-3